MVKEGMIKRQVLNLEYEEWMDIDENGYLVGTDSLVYRVIDEGEIKENKIMVKTNIKSELFVEYNNKKYSGNITLNKEFLDDDLDKALNKLCRTYINWLRKIIIEDEGGDVHENSPD